MPALANDTFDRADENPLSGGGNWTVLSTLSTLKVVGNVAVPSTLIQDNASYYSGISWPDNQYSKANLAVTGVTGGSSGVGVMVRAAGSAITCYRLVVDHAASANVDVGKMTAGAYSNIARFTQAWTDGDLWELDVIGNILRVFLNSVQVGVDQFDSSIASGFAGLFYSSTETAASIDNWEGGSVILTPASLIGSAQQPVVWATRIRS